jgi:hypothetical protein
MPSSQATTAVYSDPGVNSVLSASNLDQVTEGFRGYFQLLQSDHTLMWYWQVVFYNHGVTE